MTRLEMIYHAAVTIYCTQVSNGITPDADAAVEQARSIHDAIRVNFMRCPPWPVMSDEITSS